MSRSYKKVAIVKQGSKYHKKLSNKRFRKKSKSTNLEQNSEKLPKKPSEITNQYDVVDWIFRANKNDDYYNKFKRK